MKVILDERDVVYELRVSGCARIPSMKLAIVADWLTVFGGAEHVIAEMLAVFPDAPVFTTVARKSALGPLASKDIRVTALQKWHRLLGHHQPLLSLMPKAIESIDLRGFDVILSSSHAVAKGVIPPSNAVHICYCHTPMRYVWEMETQYLEDFRIPERLRKPIRRRLMMLRRWDLSTAKRVDLFIANSHETAERIKRIYGRESVVLHPPVQDRFFSEPVTEERSGFLTVGRLVPYKQFHLVVELANKHALPLTVIGVGQEEKRLRTLAGPTVRVQGFVQDEKLPAHYRKAKAVFFPPHEDAGIVPLEAEASGTPVIAYGKGGARDTVVEGKTGLFFREQSLSSLEEAFSIFETMTFDHEAIREHARQFSASRFRDRLKSIVEKKILIAKS